MSKALLPLMAILCLAVMLAFSIQSNKKMVNEKEKLILRNDSLHVREIKAKRELLLVQSRLDSLLGAKIKLSK